MRTILAVSMAVTILVSSELSHAQDPSDGSIAPGVAAGSHVRTDDAEIQRLITTGIARSAAFRALITALNESDVIVYVRRGSMRVGYRGYLVHRVIESAGHRLLQMRVDPRGAEARTIGLIGHELQHAVEVARARDVGRTRTIDDYFREISDDVCMRGGDCFETSAAMRIQNLVTSEMQ